MISGWVDRAHTADISAIYLLLDSYKDSGVLRPKTPKDIYRSLPHFFVYRSLKNPGVADVATRVYSTATDVRACACLIPDGELARLGSVAVSATYAGTGVGKFFLRSLLLREGRKYRGVYCYSRRSTFFEKMDFSLIEKSRQDEKGKSAKKGNPLSCMSLEKRRALLAGISSIRDARGVKLYLRCT